MTSPSPEEARALLIEAIKAAWDEQPDLNDLALAIDPEAMLTSAATVALDAVLAARTEPETCETCRGSGWQTWTVAVRGARDQRCLDCHGSGSRSLYLLDVIRKGE